MDLYRSVLRPLAFRFDPEWVHHRALGLIQKGLMPGVTPDRKEVKRFGVTFPNPVGLAAGFDKDGVALDRWQRLGFGFVEVGTVTPKPQPGNPKPRLFRLPADGGVINRMGFNNGGAQALADRIATAKPGIPLGINIGKNKTTEEADAPADYLACFRTLHTFGDYFVVNVSSPNTPGLRALQDPESLIRILEPLKALDSTRPLFVKIAPDLTDEAIIEVAALVERLDLAGIVATNTTISREGLAAASQETAKEMGGLSGTPVRARAQQVAALLRGHLAPERTLIGVGGIMSPADAKARMEAGADLVQLYTGWIYGGPNLVPEIVAAL